MIWAILFWISVFIILHTYLLFPLILKVLAAKEKQNEIQFTRDDELPFISVIMAVHNEEKVIIDKVRSIFKTDYPEEQFELIVGSDASTDKTNEILHIYSNDNPGLHFFPFEQRRGKAEVINELRNKARGEILVLSDANVMFSENTLFELAKHFKNKDIGLVGSNLLNSNIDKTGISIQESSFISRELRLKYYEGKIWGTMMGAFGGCYALRYELYSPVPEGYTVDDFYITMKVLEKQKKSIQEISAICYEDVQNQMKEEFRRKIRISSGNFQNLRSFRHLLWPLFTGLSFCFLSHKILRWLVPFFLLLALVSNAFIYRVNMFYTITLIGQLALILLPFIDLMVRKIGIHIVLLRFITHFYSMNLALLIGFIKFLTGRKTNVWEPTSRVEGKQ
jgi:cellulose synthase/poly-beta-1,6-N-acetylglucosamine synthase-like glycosyltransferase